MDATKNGNAAATLPCGHGIDAPAGCYGYGLVVLCITLDHIGFVKPFVTFSVLNVLICVATKLLRIFIFLILVCTFELSILEFKMITLSIWWSVKHTVKSNMQKVDVILLL